MQATLTPGPMQTTAGARTLAPTATSDPRMHIGTPMGTTMATTVSPSGTRQAPLRAQFVTTTAAAQNLGTTEVPRTEMPMATNIPTAVPVTTASTMAPATMAPTTMAPTTMAPNTAPAYSSTRPPQSRTMSEREFNDYMSTVSGPLTTDSTRPIDTSDARDRINRQVFNDLIKFHDKTSTDAYFQSHPFSNLYTSHTLAVDEATLQDNYMRIIFGGAPDPEKDNINLGYVHALKATETAPTGGFLRELTPGHFVEGKQATKDSLLDTFARTREYHRGQLDSDAERFMKARVGHELTHVTYYGKDVTPAGQASRFHFVTGQHGHLQHRPDTTGMQSWWNLSSKTYAPDGNGGEVPLRIQAEIGEDPRQVPISDDLKVYHKEPLGEFNNNDIGSYPGRDTDRFVTDYVEDNPNFTSLFQNQRKWR